MIDRVDLGEHYGADERTSVSFLEFGSIDFSRRSKTTWGFLIDDRAYDFCMVARYVKDLMSFEWAQAFQNNGLPTAIGTWNHARELLPSLAG